MLRLIPTSFLDRALVNQFDYDLRFQVKSIRSIDRALAIQSRSGIRLRFQAIDAMGVGICTSRVDCRLGIKNLYSDCNCVVMDGDSRLQKWMVRLLIPASVVIAIVKMDGFGIAGYILLRFQVPVSELTITSIYVLLRLDYRDVQQLS
ncbi:hypothetical protein L2E82_11186 [Cichorium intybus]|uniref:Uncharacterized protein n=1 Tax=Cichorium intybus TaxID=13427 RepID=A0ACB9GDV0_CICIN|nr:hypothetical protein L2E82_11186 [Cichorium intybus]